MIFTELFWWILPIPLGLITGEIIWKLVLEKPTVAIFKTRADQEKEIAKLLAQSEAIK